MPSTFCDVLEPAVAAEQVLRLASDVNVQLLLKLFKPRGASNKPFAVTLL